jgi:uncharacterized lipoprotein NlpE involved in copper resistance
MVKFVFAAMLCALTLMACGNATTETTDVDSIEVETVDTITVDSTASCVCE